MHGAIQAFRYVNIVTFTMLAVVGFRSWQLRRDRASMWAAATFCTLGAVEILSLVPNHPGHLAERAVGRIGLAVFVLFPYLLFRFTLAFRRSGKRLENAVFALTALLVLWTFLLPSLPQPGERWPAWFLAYVVVFMLHWSILSIASSVRLWRAGTAQPTVARRRMHLLALASAALVLALLLAVFTTNRTSGIALGTQIFGFASGLAFLVGFAPPTVFRVLWRAREAARLQQAIASLLSFAQSQEEVAARVLQPAAEIVGARALAIRNADGRVVAAWEVPDRVWEELERGRELPRLWEDAEVLELEVPGGSLLVWTSPYAPFFGDEELALLETLGALTGLALDRVRLFQAEHEARLALERADEVKSNFVALAAHELRTPVTTIHGFVTTLHQLGEKLEDDQRERVRDALLQQTQRMTTLVEQLLDLSRLDAEAIEIAPEPLHVRSHVQEIVAAAVGDPAAVAIDVPEDAIAVADRNALERIVSNLITNAFRYGQPPVTVRAEQSDRHFRLSVEDSGSGVAPEFVPDLFERFSRGDGARVNPVGTGLGLAIARSYARAHGGDLLYEDAQPRGARFLLVLPSRWGDAA